jgi:hypothetical protein
MALENNVHLDSYELLDCGDGRRLERFGPAILDRPAPQCDWKPKRAPTLWKQATATYERSGSHGSWHTASGMDPIPLKVGSLSVELRLSENGQVGMFPEQLNNWQWIHTLSKRARGTFEHLRARIERLTDTSISSRRHPPRSASFEIRPSIL